ncbi:MAG: tRNA pseudouridine(38-40) synthase TruA [Gammaproteobacteria bacterium]|nr:tRNA pseudouridine(38-40) synthase TruA [Gammaproteobacteria bacterium]
MDSQSTQERQLYRVALGLEYDGSPYCGWQRQLAPELPSIQHQLEQALSRIVSEPTKVFCAGRTDKGVHASGQVVHFETPVDRGKKAWVTGTNSLLPASIRVRWAHDVPPEFHARFSATYRRYLYLINESRIRSAHIDHLVTHVPFQLDVQGMHEAGQFLLGEHDFSSFRAAGCQSNTPWRCINWLNIRRRNRFIVVDIKANAFLQHMVRNIVGALLEVGRGTESAGWVKELLESRDRTAGAVTAPANGLYFVRAGFPAEYDLPESTLGPIFLQPYP